MNSLALNPVQSSRWWSASVALRGFYDDNYVSRYSGSETDNGRKGSFGLEVQPSIFIHKDLEATTISAGYTYGFHHQERRGTSDHYHLFNASVVHKVSDISTLTVTEYFAIAQEPQILNQDQGGGLQQRTDGSNIRNTGSVEWRSKMSDQLGYTLGYANTLFSYHDNNHNWVTPPGGTPPNSYAAKLNRMEQLPSVSLRYDVKTDTTALVGYQFQDVSYTESRDILAQWVDGAGNVRTYMPDARDSRSHFYFVGLEHTFNPKLSGWLRVGAMTVSYIRQNTPTRTNPYADLAASYRYAEGSMLQLGFRHTRSATDLAGAQPGTGSLTMDQETSMAYLSLNHEVTKKLSVNGMLSAQYGAFRGGPYENTHERSLNASLGGAYQFNRNLSLEAGYNFDVVPSDLPAAPGEQRAYHRNYFWLGIKATL
ncbi:MAG: outer membrane beta-barrel protein [Verrucomicrobiota bacterium]